MTIVDKLRGAAGSCGETAGSCGELRGAAAVRWPQVAAACRKLTQTIANDHRLPQTTTDHHKLSQTAAAPRNSPQLPAASPQLPATHHRCQIRYKWSLKMQIGGNIVYGTRTFHLPTLRVVVLRYSRPNCSLWSKSLPLVCRGACSILAL